MPNCLVTGGAKNDTAPIDVLLLNVAKTQHWIDHVVIYHDGISGKQQKLMQSVLPVEFIRYQFPGSKRNFNEIVEYVYTEMVFCKYECLKLLERFDNVVWTDYDVVFQRDVKELLDFRDGSSGWKSFIQRRREIPILRGTNQILRQGGTLGLLPPGETNLEYWLDGSLEIKV